MLGAFESVDVIPERFPVKTKVHSGWKAKLFDGVIVRLFKILPKSWVRWSGHHLMAFATKAAAEEPERTQESSGAARVSA